MATKSPKFGPMFASVSYVVKVRGESGCSIVSSMDLAEDQAACYLSSRPSGVVDVFYSELCRCCAGSGRVRKSRRMLSWRECPACSGKAELFPDTLIRTIAS